MKTAITELLGIDHPIILAAMAWVTNAKMVAAISEAGGLGTLGPNAGATTVTKDVNETAERMRQQIRQVRALTDKPFAINFVVGMAGADKAYADRCAEVGIEEQIPVAIVSQGSPDVYTDRLKKAGIKVIHVCATVRHAQKAEERGADAVVASGTEGGGHSGFDQNTTFCLVPQVTGAVNIPVVAGGGIADGRQLFAVLSLGAEGVYVGTRFIATTECPAHQDYKDAILRASDGDTIAIRHGSIGKFGSGNRGFSIERRGSLRVILNDRIRNLMMEHGGQIDFDTLMTGLHPASSADVMLREDTAARGYAAGQGVGLIQKVVACRTVIEQMMEEMRLARERACKM
jgi:enoyl-[acyl-carrier protein] reductase II